MDFNAIDPVKLILVVVGGIAVAILSVSAVWPFTGTLIRYWAHYSPKRVVLGDENRGERGLLQINVANDTPTFNGYWSLFLRVKRVEGIRGLWKGLGTFYLLYFCTLAMMLAVILLITVFGVALSPSLPIVILITLIAIYISSIPVRVVVNRSLTTSRRLHFMQPLMAYKTLLFTPAERRNPFRLCLLPGVLISVIVLDVESGFLSSIKTAITKALYYDRTLSLQSVGLSIVLSCVSALLMTPIEVVITRLSVQETPSTDDESLSPPAVSQGQSGGYDILPQSLEAEDPPNYQESEGIEYAGADEDVINLRTDQEPYKGMVDCAKSIVREEGWGTFWRGWFVPATFFFLLDMDMILMRNLNIAA